MHLARIPPPLPPKVNVLERLGWNLVPRASARAWPRTADRSARRAPEGRNCVSQSGHLGHPPRPGPVLSSSQPDLTDFPRATTSSNHS